MILVCDCGGDRFVIETWHRIGCSKQRLNPGRRPPIVSVEYHVRCVACGGVDGNKPAPKRRRSATTSRGKE